MKDELLVYLTGSDEKLASSSNLKEKNIMLLLASYCHKSKIIFQLEFFKVLFTGNLGFLNK